MTATRVDWVDRYHCPPDGRGKAPWCSNLPCPGHRSTKDQRAAARLLAHVDGGEKWWDLRAGGSEREAYLLEARLAIHEMRQEQA